MTNSRDICNYTYFLSIEEQESLLYLYDRIIKTSRTPIDIVGIYGYNS